MPNFEGGKAPSPHHLQPEVARGDGRSLPNPARRERSLGNSLLQSNSLPACMCAFVRNVHEVRVPHARTRRSAFPPRRPVPPHPLEKKKLSALPGMKSRAVVAVKTIQQAGWYILELR